MGSVSELVSILDGWQGNWNSTVPEGKTPTDERIIGVTFSTSSNIDLRYDFSEASGRRRVIIRGVGTFGKSGGGTSLNLIAPVTWSGVIDCTTGCKNITLSLLQFQGSDRIESLGSEDLTLERNDFIGNGWGDWTNLLALPSTNYGLRLADDNASGAPAAMITTRMRIANNTFRFFADAAILIRGNHEGMVIEGNVLDVLQHDDFKTHWGEYNDYRFLRNWGAKIRVGPVGSKYHEDFNQWTYSVTNRGLIWGNVAWRGGWYGGSNGAYQGFFLAPGNNKPEPEIYDTQFSNNIIVNNNKAINRSCIGSGNRVTNNGSFKTYDLPGGSSSYMGNGPWSQDHNVATVQNDSDLGAGTTNGGITLRYLNKTNPDTGPHLEHFDETSGAAKMFGSLQPKASSPLHWDYAGTKVGPWERLKEVFVEGVHPGNVGWPVAPVWEDRYNGDGKVPTTYTGVFDVDGNNL